MTHNWGGTASTLEHLAAQHSHIHDHAALSHEHVPHQDFPSEHESEAHVHDHGEPVEESRKAMAE